MRFIGDVEWGLQSVVDHRRHWRKVRSRSLTMIVNKPRWVLTAVVEWHTQSKRQQHPNKDIDQDCACVLELRNYSFLKHQEDDDADDILSLSVTNNSSMITKLMFQTRQDWLRGTCIMKDMKIKIYLLSDWMCLPRLDFSTRLLNKKVFLPSFLAVLSCRWEVLSTELYL